MTSYTININDHPYKVEVDDPSMPLLWAIRDYANLTGTKYGCGIAQCGACTVHLDGIAVRSCSIPLSSVGARKVTTIEGLAKEGLHPLQQAWMQVDVPQCGYCQAGQLMTAASLLKKNPKPTDQEITQAMSGNLCRCGTYQSIHEAVKIASTILKTTSVNE